jgi:hypothetical protein
VVRARVGRMSRLVVWQRESSRGSHGIAPSLIGSCTSDLLSAHRPIFPHQHNDQAWYTQAGSHALAHPSFVFLSSPASHKKHPSTRRHRTATRHPPAQSNPTFPSVLA